VLWAKAAVLTLTAPLLFVPATFATFLVSQSVLSREQLGTSLNHPGVARAVLGSALYLTAVGLLGLGLGALLRNTAGATASLFGVLFGLQIVVGFLPASVADNITRYLPTPAGVAVTNVRPDPSSLGPWTGFGLFCLYTAIVLGLAARPAPHGSGRRKPSKYQRALEYHRTAIKVTSSPPATGSAQPGSRRLRTSSTLAANAP
jgi:ABC-2 type transport system permease protein